MIIHAIRILPGQDVREEIDKFSRINNIQAGVVLTCVGNLRRAVIRMANERIVKRYVGSYEILSMDGTLENGNSHLHICISDELGNVQGGHLKNGTITGTTIEVVILEITNLSFSREFDNSTGFNELVVTKKNRK